MSILVHTPERKPEVQLLDPPFKSIQFPSDGVASLVGYLRSHHYPAEQRDLNIDFYYFLMRNFEVDSPYSLSQEQRHQYLTALLSSEDVKIFPDTHFFYPPPRLTNELCPSLKDRNSLYRYIRNPRLNPFHQYYEQKVIPDLLASKASLFGISITHLTQVAPGLTLAHLIREHIPDRKIAIGGTWCTNIYERLLHDKDLAKFVDFVVIREGETPLCQLVQAISCKDKRYDSIPNLLYSTDDGGFALSSRCSREDVNELSSAVYDNLDSYPRFGGFSSYAGKKAAIYQTARGCYWDKCTFCVHRDSFMGSLSRRNIDKCIYDIEELVRAHNVEYIIFGDTAIPPARMRELSEAMQKADVDIHWWAFIRASSEWDDSTLQSARNAGCNALWLGAESGNDRVLERMQKGVTSKVIGETIRKISSNGIDLGAEFIAGFPTETRREFLDTIEFAKRHRGHLVNIGANPFILWRNSEVHRFPQRYDITVSDPEESVDCDVDYEVRRELCLETMEKEEIGILRGLLYSLNADVGVTRKKIQRVISPPITADVAFDWRKITPINYRLQGTIVHFPGMQPILHKR